jgi:hypothetical protein
MKFIIGNLPYATLWFASLSAVVIVDGLRNAFVGGTAGVFRMVYKPALMDKDKIKRILEGSVLVSHYRVIT